MSQSGCISIHINGRAIDVESGLTILQAARLNGIEIPTLCDFPGLPSHGSCRLCVVEIAGRPNTPTACTTPVEQGMVISTHSPKVVALRKEVIHMLLAEHPAGCLFCPEKDRCDDCMVTLRKAAVTTGCGSCPKDSQCELQTLAEKYEIRQPGYPIRYRMLPVENHDPFFDRDPNLCILCGRCIRVCQELHFANTLTYSGRGSQALVSTAFQRSHLETDCTFCGSCVEVCPTGAISEKTRKWDGRPERVTASTCPFCSIGCQLDLLSKGERIIGSLPSRQAGTAVGTNVLCVNGRFGITELVDPAARLKRPLHLAGNAWQPAAWEYAIRLAAEKLSACTPGRFEMRISAACSNEDLFVARQFSREVMKTSPVLASARRRYGSALSAIARLLRVSTPLEALEGERTILCIGMDDPYALSVVAVQLKRAKSRGAKLIHLSLRASRSRELAWSDVQLPTSDAASVLRGLAGLITGRTDNGHTADPGVEQAARLLAQSTSPAILVGAAALADPQNAAVLREVEELVRSLKAQVTILPEESNLAGALRLELTDAVVERSGLDVLYLIGEPVPESQTGQPFVISHALALPDSAFNGLLFPAAAFSEEHGTMIDYAGRVQMFRPAVQPPGEALPAWKVLAQIACQMGAPGFEYTCVEDIWQAAQAEFAGFPAHHGWPGPTVSETASLVPGAGWREPVYMGQPLARRVAGLRSLYPESSNARAHE